MIYFPNSIREEYQLIIRDITGKVVKQINEITVSQVEIYRVNLPSGLYVIKLRGEKSYKGKILVE